MAKQSVSNPFWKQIYGKKSELQPIAIIFEINVIFGYFPKIKPMSTEKEITIYDIAKHLNISPATVSRGLKDHPAINKNTRKRISDTARELGYRSNNFASSLRSKRTNTLGVIVPKLNSNFMSAAIAGMESVANEEGYNLIISQSQESTKKEVANAHTMFNNRVDGLLVSLAYDTTDVKHLEPFINKKTPVILFDRTFDNSQCLCIVIDNYKAAYEVTKHLILQGCKRIMHLGGNTTRNVYADRLNGYKQALADNGIPFDESLVYLSSLSEEDGKAAGDYILSMKKKPDGIFAANDSCGIFCMLRLKAAGIKIPADIAVAGFNNDPLCMVVEPNLTTVNYPGYAMGKAAATYMINHLNGSTSLDHTNTIVLRSELVVRKSSLKKG
jgi:LacI family transcriptional regulator